MGSSVVVEEDDDDGLCTFDECRGVSAEWDVVVHVVHGGIVSALKPREELVGFALKGLRAGNATGGEATFLC